jgi:hypothetical protein
MRRHSVPWAVRRRLAEAEAAVADRWNSRAAEVLSDALNAAGEPTKSAAMQRIRDLYRGNALPDPIAQIIAAVAEVAPEVAARVRSRLGIGNDRGSL